MSFERQRARWSRRLAPLSALTAAAIVSVSNLAFAAPDASEDIRDIRAPIAIPPWWRWPLAIAAAALASLAIVLAVRWWQKRREARRTPLERARAALLAAEAHARAGRAKAWAEIVAETLRSALARKLGAAVLPQTTSELARKPLTGASVPQDVIELLTLCDLARFALATVDPETLLLHTKEAREIVERLFAPAREPTVKPTESATRLEESVVTS